MRILDTNTAIFILRREPPEVRRKLSRFYHDAIIVIDNAAEYARVPGLKVEHWLKRGRG